MVRRLRVAQECPEPWDEMQPTASGRYCERCQKRVLDLSALTEDDAALIVGLSARGSICGRLAAPVLLSVALATAACGGGATNAPAPTVAAPSATAASAPTAVADVDSDNDRIPDANDQCPNDPETYNGLKDEDGCPDKPLGVIVDTVDVQITTQVPFAKNVAKIPPESLAKIDEIARVLKENPDIGILVVRGHATPDEAKPGALVKERASAVVEALVKAGADRNRLRATSDPTASRVVDFELTPPPPDPAACAPKP